MLEFYRVSMLTLLKRSETLSGPFLPAGLVRVLQLRVPYLSSNVHSVFGGRNAPKVRSRDTKVDQKMDSSRQFDALLSGDLNLVRVLYIPLS